MKNLTQCELNKFNNRWERVNDCHLWMNSLDKDGYGSFYFRKKSRRAHRVAYYGFFGEIPKGYVVNHICRNRHCVNPQHLQAVTVYDNNMKDSKSVGYINSQKTHCKKGHPFDKKYGKQRYCSICEREKSKRLQKKWREEDTLNV